jgi:hypothetical protein
MYSRFTGPKVSHGHLCDPGLICSAGTMTMKSTKINHDHNDMNTDNMEKDEDNIRENVEEDNLDDSM